MMKIFEIFALFLSILMLIITLYIFIYKQDKTEIYYRSLLHSNGFDVVCDNNKCYMSRK